MVYGILVGDAMTSDPITCKKELSIKQAVALMLSENIGSLLIVKDKKLVGIFTEKDILKKIIAAGMDPEKTKLENVMVRDIFTIGPDADLSEAAELMVRKDIRRLPVVEEEKLVGILTEKDLIRIEPTVVDILLQKKRIEEVSRESSKRTGVHGPCENCSNFSDDLEEIDGSFVCPHCR